MNRARRKEENARWPPPGPTHARTDARASPQRACPGNLIYGPRPHRGGRAALVRLLPASKRSRPFPTSAAAARPPHPRPTTPPTPTLRQRQHTLSRGGVHMRLRRRPVTTTAPLGAATSSRVVVLPGKDAAPPVNDNDAGAQRAPRETTPWGRSRLRSPSRRSRSLVSWRSADRARGAGSAPKRGDPYKDSATLIAAAAAVGARGAAAASGSCAAVPPLLRTAARGAAAAAASPVFARGSSPSPPHRDNPAGAARAFFRRSEEDGFASIIPSSSSSVRSQRRSPPRASVRTASSILAYAHPPHPSRSGHCPLLAAPPMWIG